MAEINSPSTVKITAPYGPKGTTVIVDGVRIPHIRNVSFRHMAGDLPTVTLEFAAREGVEIEAQANVTPLVLCANCGGIVRENQERLTQIMRAKSFLLD